MLIYEHLHLPEADRRSCRRLLEDAGYELMEEFFDTFCLDTGPEDTLTRRWRLFAPRPRPRICRGAAQLRCGDGLGRDRVAELHRSSRDRGRGCAQRTLDRLEDLRLRLEERFDDAPGGITVVVHPSPGWLAAAHPFLPGARLAAAPAGRRYLAGWAMASELHILNDEYTDRRAAGEDSLAALRAPPSASTRRS